MKKLVWLMALAMMLGMTPVTGTAAETAETAAVDECQKLCPEPLYEQRAVRLFERRSGGESLCPGERRDQPIQLLLNTSGGDDQKIDVFPQHPSPVFEFADLFLHFAGLGCGRLDGDERTDYLRYFNGI